MSVVVARGLDVVVTVLEQLAGVHRVFAVMALASRVQNPVVWISAWFEGEV